MNVCILWMLYFNRIYVSEVILVNKKRESKERGICPYWYFLKKDFKFEANVCNRCRDLLAVSVNLSDIAVLNIKSADYRFIIIEISKNKAINVIKNAD